MSLNNIKSAFQNWVDGPQPNNSPCNRSKVQGKFKPNNDMIRYCEQDLYQLIDYMIDKRLNPLVRRIQHLQHKLKSNGINKCQRNDKSEDVFKFLELNGDMENESGERQIRHSMQIEEYQQSAERSSRREGLASTNKQEGTFSLGDAQYFSSKLETVVVKPKNLPRWKYLCKLMRNIFIARASRTLKIWTKDQQKTIVKFILFGYSQIGLCKKQMVSLAGISQSSFKRWRRIFEAEIEND